MKEEINEKTKQNILRKAKMLDYNLERLIQTCDSWLSEEEGRKNVHLRWTAREKARRKEQKKMFINLIFKLVGIKKRCKINHNVLTDYFDKEIK